MLNWKKIHWCKLGFHKWLHLTKDIKFETSYGEDHVLIVYRKCTNCGLKQKRVADPYRENWITIPNKTKKNV